jgi:hypothetical protein
VFDAATLTQIEGELTQAEAARQAGFEGRARVSARRAAGIAIRAHLLLREINVGRASAYDLLEIMLGRTVTSPELHQVIEHLLARVNEEYQLPLPVDLIAETRWLVQNLNKDSMHGNEFD